MTRATLPGTVVVPALLTPRETFGLLRKSYDWMIRRDPATGRHRWMGDPDLLACAVPDRFALGCYLFRADLLARVVAGERIVDRVPKARRA